MKSKLQQKKENTNSKYWKKKADRAWGELVHLMFDKCAVNNTDCSGPIQAHHILHRGKLAIRHNPKVGLGLCANHHQYHPDLSPHRGVFGFMNWLREQRPAQYNWCMERRHSIQENKADYKARHEALCMMIEYINRIGAVAFSSAIWKTQLKGVE